MNTAEQLDIPEHLVTLATARAAAQAEYNNWAMKCPADLTPRQRVNWDIMGESLLDVLVAADREYRDALKAFRGQS